MSDNADSAPSWHAVAWARAATALAGGRMPHALLVCGGPGVGNKTFAARIVRALVCHDRGDDENACGVCGACRQYAAASHPDIARLVPGQPGQMIGVEQVRAFSQRLHLTPQYANGRVGVIDPAERLSISASNSLLKTLEEPPISCHIVLVCDRVSALAATIRSRCQLWRIPAPPPEAARAWLRANGHDSEGLDDDSLAAPLGIIARAQRNYAALAAQWDDALTALLQNRADPVELAADMAKQPADLWLDWLYRRAGGLLALALGSAGAASMPARLRRAATALPARALEAWCARVAESARLAQTNADWRLVVESLLLDLDARSRA